MMILALRKMKLIDAHVHLSDTEYAGHIDELIADAKNAGVTALVTNSMDFKTCQNDIAVSREIPRLSLSCFRNSSLERECP